MWCIHQSDYHTHSHIMYTYIYTHTHTYKVKQHVELMCLRLEKGASVFIRVVTPHIQQLLNAHEAMVRIRCVFF